MSAADPSLSRLRHDLLTPVNHILGYSEILLEDASPSTSADLKKIHSAARSLQSLISTHLGGTSTPPRPTAPAAPPTERPPLSGRVLAVDDHPDNLDLLARHLRRQGLEVETATNGLSALECLESTGFDLVLLDVLMPGLDGCETLHRIKSSPATADLPVIMISALDELASVTRCIEAGAEDYLPKPFDPTLLRARLSACLEKKALRDAERRHLETIETTRRRLDKELTEAGAYVRSILPPPLDSPLRVRWKYRPSSELAGDSFGYHSIDPDHFAIYLLDVCGHGVGASLLSVAAINMIRSGALPETDFRRPGQVLAALNKAFPMERQNNLYFTLWYGVANTAARTLAYASAGHPPAVLTSSQNPPKRLSTEGLIVGVLENTPYKEASHPIAPGDRLFVCSDGCYEIQPLGGPSWDFNGLVDFLAAKSRNVEALDQLETHALSMRGSGSLDDDFSILSVEF